MSVCVVVECVCDVMGCFYAFFFVFLWFCMRKFPVLRKHVSTHRHTHARLCVHKHTLRLEGTNKPLEGPILEKYNKAIVTLCGGHT